MIQNLHVIFEEIRKHKNDCECFILAPGVEIRVVMLVAKQNRSLLSFMSWPCEVQHSLVKEMGYQCCAASAVKMEAVHSSKIPISIYQTAGHGITEHELNFTAI
jgi:hypothetical protein